MQPSAFDQLRPGTYDPRLRVDDMNANGVLASLNFPTMPSFAGGVFVAMAKKDPEEALRACRPPGTTGTCRNGAPARLAGSSRCAWCPAAGHGRDAEGTEADERPWRPCRVVLRQSRQHRPAQHPQRILGAVLEGLQRQPDRHQLPYRHWCAGAASLQRKPNDAWITAMPISIANSAADWTFATFWKRYADGAFRRRDRLGSLLP